MLTQKYDTKTLENDIALIELQTSVNYTDFIRPICVPPSDYNVTNEVECYTTGWGAIGEKNFVVLPSSIHKLGFYLYLESLYVEPVLAEFPYK